jgi:CheY-like chemotaxis protein
MACSVLVVDDDASFRHLAARIVSSWGHLVIGQAATVAEALSCAAELRPDAVLVDVGLPDGDGFTLTQDLLALPHPPRVVLISSDPAAANEASAREVGASGFLVKDELPGARSRRLIEGG